ncbi:MAG: c-type cytochrome [Rhodospirillaceae bacterium]
MVPMTPVQRATLLVAAVLLVAMMSTSVSSAGAAPVENGDGAPGRSLALANCTYCHVVAPDQSFAPVLRPQGPDFSTVAANPANTTESLRKFLLTTHQNFSNAKGMPNPLLSKDQVADVVSFILSQRKAP